MGIGGKAERLMDIHKAKNDGVLVLERFSDGGTFVVDHLSLWTTFIGRNKLLPDVAPFSPREIMEWSADVVFGPAFESWNREISSSSRARSSRERRPPPVEKETQQTNLLGAKYIKPVHLHLDDAPKFQLRGNDYVLGERNIGGNAQSIVSGGFLHQTNILWDWDDTNMEYLTLPEKQLDDKGDHRPHDEVFVRLKDHYGKHSSKNTLFSHVKNAAGESFELEEMTLNDVLKISNDKFGGLQKWFDGKCRTKVVKL